LSNEIFDETERGGAEGTPKKKKLAVVGKGEKKVLKKRGGKKKN